MPYFTVPAFGIGWIVAIAIIIAASITIEVIRNRNLEIDKVDEIIEDFIVLKVTVPQSNDTSAETADHMFSTIHGILGTKQKSFMHVSFEMSVSSYGIQFYVVTPPRYKTFIEGQIYANYPSAEVIVSTDYAAGLASINSMGFKFVVAEGELEKDSMFPINTYKLFDYDTLSSLTSSLGTMQEYEMLAMQVLVRPINSKWQKSGRDAVDNMKKGIHPKGKNKGLKNMLSVIGKIYEGVFSIRHLRIKPSVPVDRMQQKEMELIEDKLSKQGYETAIRIIASAKTEESAYAHMANFISSLRQFNNPTMNGFSVHIYTENETDKLEEYINDYKSRKLDLESNDILNTEEIATLFHFPNKEVQTPLISWMKAKKAEAPVNIPNEQPYFAQTNFRGTVKQFGIKNDDRRRHMYMIGKTGSGKTTMMKNLIIQDILNGAGVGVIDPHGELIASILEHIPEERMKDVILIDPADQEYPVSINIFDLKEPIQRDYIANSILDVFKKHFDSWGPRLEYILHNVILSLLYEKDATMLGIQRILTDYSYRRKVLADINDPILLKFWNEEYAYMERNSRLISETIAPIQNKVGRFLSAPTIRHIVGQAESKVNFDDVLNNKKILLCNLSQGRIGEESSSLLGSLIITKIQSSAMARVSMLDSQRSDFYLYIDEFQNFSTNSFVKILSEARKYRLNLVLAHQYLSQLSEEVKDAVFGNIGTLISFIVGSPDAANLEKEFFPVFTAHDLVSLEKYQIYLKESIDGFISKPFSADSMIMEFPRSNIRDEIITSSRRLFANDRASVEDEIRSWSMNSFPAYTKRTPVKNADQVSLDLEAHESKNLTPQQRLRLN